MAICENCGKKYAPTATAPDCPNCAPAAEEVPIVPRRRQAAPAGAPAGGGAPPQRPAAPQGRPAAAPPRAVAPPPRGATSRGVPAAPPAPAHHGHHFQHPELLQKPGIEPIVKIGFGIAVGLLIVTAVVFFTVKGKLDKDKEAWVAVEDAKRNLKAYINERDYNNEVQAREIIAKANEVKDTLLANDDDLKSFVQTAVAKCTVTLEQSQQRKDAEAKLAGIEAGLKNTTGLTAENVRDFETQLSELTRLELPVESFNKRIKAALDVCGHLYGTKLHDDSVAYANSNASQPRLGLNRYYQAEEELKRLLDDAYRAAMSGKTPEDKAKGEEDKKFFEPMYKEIVEAADRTAVQLFTADVVDGISYTDMLSGPQATNWNPKKYQAVNGGLEVDAADPALKGAPLVSIGDREQIRNFLLEMDFTVERGSAQVLFHLGKNVTPNTQIFDIKTSGQDENVTAGKTMQARCAIIGDQFTWRFLNSDLGGEIKQTISWTFTRKGGIGFQVNPGAKIKVTKFKLKILQ
jgi:hypothetical protein